MDDEDSEYSCDNPPESYELNDTGIMGESSESETDVLFRNLEEELRGLMRSYSVQPSDLEQLFQVVHQMFEIMDANQEALNTAHSDKQELENLWMQAKDELKHTKKAKANLQSVLEDEQMRHESERVEYEKEMAVMATKIKQVKEYKHIVEQDLVKMKEKMNQNDQKRTEILELYKKQLDAGKTATLKRRGGTGTLKRRTLPRPQRYNTRAAVSVGGELEASDISAHFLSMTMSCRTDSFMASAEVPVHVTFPHDEQDEKEAQRLSRPSWVVQSKPRPVNQSLAEELRSEGEDITSSLAPNSRTSNHNSRTNGDDSAGGETGGTTLNVQEGGGDEVNENSLEDEFEDDECFEELLAVDPQMITEVEMLQKEKEGWEGEQRQLEEEKKTLREQKDDFERQNIQLEVELKRLRDNHKELKEKLTDVKKERDDILDNYLEQPFDEYCITRKELHKLLMEQQITKMELEKAREEKIKLQQQLLAKRSIFEKFRHRMKRMLTKQNQQAVTEKREMEPLPKSLPPPIPVVRDISLVIEKGDYVIKKGWLMSHDSHVPEHNLPNWMGQITLKGVETERLECSAIARIFQSPMKGKSLNLKNHTPQQQVALLSSVQQLHVEVWTATVEGPSVRMEIIDIIARPPRVRQRFVMKPKTAHIVCMTSIPGEVDPSTDFTDSLNISQDLEDTTKPYQPPSRRHSSYLGPRFGQKGNRPFSAPKERGARSSSVMSSTPNLGLSSASDTGPLMCLDVPSPELLRATPPKKQAKKVISSIADTSYKADGLSSSSCTMLTILEDTDGAGRTTKGGGGGGGDVGNEITEGREKSGTNDEQQSRGEGEDSLDDAGARRLGDQEFKTEDDSSASLSTSSLEMVDKEEAPKVPALGVHSLLSEDRLGYSDDETGQYVAKKNGHRVRSFTSTPKRPPGKHGDVRKFSESARHEGFMDDRREEPRSMVVDEYDYDCTDGGDSHTPSSPDTPCAPVMWILTEEQNLLFYPTTDPSHRPINRVKLRYQGLCMAYVPMIGEQRPRVFIGHAHAKISVYCMDEFKNNVWDIDNPDEITLPSFNPNEMHDVRCIARVKDRLWVGAGQSIFFLNAENPTIREGSIFLDGSKKSPEAILKVGSVVVVSSRGSMFYVFDSDSARELRRFDITTVARQLDLPSTSLPSSGNGKYATVSSTSNIKTMVADSDFLYLGTSNGKIVSVPVLSLTQPSSVNWSEVSQENNDSNGTSDSNSIVLGSDSTPHVAVAVHRQMEGRVRTLLHVNLPRTKLSKLKEAAEMLHYHSMPNLSSPLGGRIPVSPPILSFRSLIISAGKGHVEYVSREEKEPEEEDIYRERHEAFQLLVWGHTNTVS